MCATAELTTANSAPTIKLHSGGEACLSAFVFSDRTDFLSLKVSGGLFTFAQCRRQSAAGHVSHTFLHLSNELGRDGKLWLTWRSAMKTGTVLIVYLLTMTFTTAAAQQQQTATSTENTFRRIEGCLAYNGVGYVLAVVSNGPKQYRVLGGEIDALRGKEGHTVEIDGPTARNNLQSMIENWDQRQATTGVGWYTITANRVRDITSNCSYPGFEHPPSQAQMN